MKNSLNGAKEWLKRFYKKVNLKKITAEEAVQHSLNKWIGLRHLKEYGLVRIYNTIYEGDSLTTVLVFNAETCALCLTSKSCATCLLHNCVEEYNTFVMTGDPEPMIKLLESKL